MKLWTIQPIEFYNELIKNGEIHCYEKHIDSHFIESYNWMIAQMENRIGKKPNKSIYPIWSWYQYKNSESKRPDLRTSSFLPKGTKGVRIEFKKSETEILLSDFNLWHFVLNYWHISDNKEQELEFDKLLELKADLPDKHVQVQQFYGYDIEPFAVELAKVTLMIAKKIAVDAIGSDENPLPLDNMDANILNEDALFADWVDFDACIGNPPYMGGTDIISEWGLEYKNQLQTAFSEIHGRADFCIYWFRKTHELMREGNRAGLVGTNSIRQNYSREGGLDYIVANDGYIYDAVSSMPWSGDAVVHISTVCWSKGLPPTKVTSLRFYEGIEGEGEQEKIIWRIKEKPEINSALSDNIDFFFI